MKKGILTLGAGLFSLALASCQNTSPTDPSGGEGGTAVKVVYEDGKGNVLQEFDVGEDGVIPEYSGGDVSLPAADASGYYVFSGWNSTAKNGTLVYTPKIEKKTYDGFTFELNADNTGLVLKQFIDPFYVADEQGNPSAKAPIEDFYIPDQALFEENFYDVTEVVNLSIQGYSIRRVHIGSKVSSFSSMAAITYHSPMISEFVVDPENPYLTVQDKVLYNKDMTELIKVPYTYSAYQFLIPDSVVKIAEQAFQLVSNITMVGTSNASNLQEIGPQAFSGSGIQSIGLPDSLTTIRIRAFWSCPNLLTIRLPKNLSVIEPLAFASCPELNTVSFDEGFTAFADSMFQGSSKIAQVVYNPADPNNANPNFTLKTVGRFAFNDVTSLRSFPFDEGLETIEESAFMNTALSGEVVLPDTLKTLGTYALSETKIVKLTLGKGLELFPASAMSATDSLQEFVVSPDNANYSTHEGALYNKDQTELVYVPRGKAGHFAVKSGTKKIGKQAIFGNQRLVSVDVPSSVVELAESAIGSNEILSSISFHEGLTTVGDYGLSYNKALKEIDLPTSVTSIGASAFAGNTSLSKLNLGGVSKLVKDSDPKDDKPGDDFQSVLDGTSNLDFANITTDAKDGIQFNGGYITIGNMLQETLSIPAQTTYIAPNAFSGFNNLKTVDFSKATLLKTLNSTTLTKVVLPSSLTKLEKDVLGVAPNLAQLDFNGTKAQWDALIKASDPNWYGSNYETLKSVKLSDGTVVNLALTNPNPPAPEGGTQPQP